MLTLTKITLSGSQYPYKLKKQIVFKSSSYLLILKKIKELVSKKTKAYAYQVTDKNYEFFEKYDNKGNLLVKDNPLLESLPFLGNDNPKFKVGDVVEYHGFNEVKLGVVMALPVTTAEVAKKGWKLDRTDDVYLVDFSKDTNEHQHPSEGMIVEPQFKVRKKERNRLKKTFQFLVKTSPVKFGVK